MRKRSRSAPAVFTTREVSELLGITPATIRELVYRDADFPKPFRPANSKLYWLRSDVLAYREKIISEFASGIKPVPPRTKLERVRDEGYARMVSDVMAKRELDER